MESCDKPFVQAKKMEKGEFAFFVVGGYMLIHRQRFKTNEIVHALPGEKKIGLQIEICLC